MDRYLCYFDGACEPNPGGVMGIGGVIFKNGEKFAEQSKDFPAKEWHSNNVAEYWAILWAIQELNYFKVKGAEIEIKGDSNLVVQQLNGNWRIKDGYYAGIARFTQDRLKELTKGNKVSITWIPGADNYLADELSRKHVEISDKDKEKRQRAKERNRRFTL